MREIEQLMNDAVVRVADTFGRENEREQAPVAGYYCQLGDQWGAHLSLLSLLLLSSLSVVDGEVGCWSVY